MAYNSYFPATYQPFFNGYQPNQQQSVGYNQQPTQQQTGWFMIAHDEKEILDYPVAPGNSITFRIENNPNYLYTKSKGAGQFDDPVCTKYRLVKEENNVTNVPKTEDKKQDIDMSAYALKTDLGAILAEIDAIKATVEAMKPKKPAKKEKDDE